MASTNKTAHYEFPQYIGSDIPNILTDINPAFETIDTALYEQGQQIAEQTTDLSDIQEAVDQATADVAVMQSSIVQMAGIVETTRQLATDNKETIGQGTLDTTAQTLIGAVNELVDDIGEEITSIDGSADLTYAQLLNTLYSRISNRDDIEELVLYNEQLADGQPTGVFQKFPVYGLTATYINFSSIRVYNNAVMATGYSLKASDSTLEYYDGSSVSSLSSTATTNVRLAIRRR